MNITRRCLLAAAAALLPTDGEAKLHGGIAHPGAVALTINENTDQSPGRIYQRAKGTYSSWNDGTCDIPVSGTYEGTPSGSLNAVVNGITYACTDFSATGGNWTATIPAVPTGDNYTATVSDPVGGAASAAQSNEWGVGILVACIGQSNMQKLWQNTASNSSVDPHARITAATGWWPVNQALTGGGAPSGGGTGICELTTAFRDGLTALSPGNTTPIGIIAGAIGGTGIQSWQTGQSSWTTWNTMVTDASVGSDYEFVLWHQGENDSEVGGDPGSYYVADLANVVAQCATQTGRSTTTLKFGVAVMGTYVDGSSFFYGDAIMDIVRTAQTNQAAQDGCFYAINCNDYLHTNGGGDGTHYAPAVYGRMGLRYANALLNQLGAVAHGSAGPSCGSPTMPIGSANITIPITQNSGGASLLDGSGSSAGTGLLGFAVNSTGGQTISATAFSGNNIVITMSAVRGASDTITMTYGAGFNPFGFTASGDSDDDLPYDNQSTYLGDDTGFPLQPTLGGIASPITVGT